MIRIQVNNIEEIAGDFVKRIEKSVIKNKLSKSERKKTKSLQDGSVLQQRIYKLYTCPPEELKDESDKFDTYINTLGYTDKKKNNLIQKYFDYDKVINYILDGVEHSYWLMKKLDVRVCPYCNRSYTFTIYKDNKKIRPQFDHFYPKDTYPFLALSFYNLIPSCPVCNHTKKTEEIDIHPYIEGFDNKCKFRIDKIEKCILNDDYEKWEIFFDDETDDKKFFKNIKHLALKEQYNEHKDFISEIVFKAISYNSEVYKSVIETFTHQGLTEKEMNLLIFGTYLEENEIGLRPLSKLSKDIIEQIGIE
ncbi:MAG: hypothetical protein GXO79_11060 [Chlorobi bacterium]|nr:hypothetical protein [Chlorobiota bacterium]